MLQNSFYAILGTFYTLLNNTDLYLSYFILSYVFLGHNDSVEWGLTVLQFDKFLQKKPQKSSQITVCHVQKLKIVRECDGLLSKVWINTAQHSEELQFIFEEYWPVLIHTLDKRPSHSHCYQVNDCQVTYIKNILLINCLCIF